MNSLKLNINKTKAVLFHPRHAYVQLPTILLNNTKIEVIKSFKSLGVYFSQNMTWDDHVNYIINKLSRTTGIMRRHCYYFPTSVNILIYNSLFLSLLNYAFLVWSTTTAGNISKLTVLQKSALRLACKVPYRYHTADLFKKYHIIQVTSMYDYKLCRLYKLGLLKNNDDMTSLARLEKNIHAYNVRHPEVWYVAKCRTNYGNQMLKFQLPTLLNHIIKEENIDISRTSPKQLRLMFV